MDPRRSQAPLVDGTSGCSCLAETNEMGRKKSMAKKLVQGSKICMPSSSMDPSMLQRISTRNKSSPRAGRRNRYPLIPGLPDDLAIACLIRVSRTEHRKLRLVCRKWRSLLSGSYYFSLRNAAAGLVQEWLYVVRRDRCGKISWEAFDPSSLSWQPLPPIPREFSQAVGFGCAVLGGCHLYLLGGRDPARGTSMRRVVFYNACTNRWQRAPDMLRRRYLFGCCAIGNSLYVSGGKGDGGRNLRTAEVYDSGRNRWFFLEEMCAPMVPMMGVVDRGGRWFLKGIRSGGEVVCEVYDPRFETWRPASSGVAGQGFLEGWRNPSTCMHGRIYTVGCKDGCKLRVYDDRTGSWSGYVHGGVHVGSSPAMEAAGIVGLNGKLCIVRNNLSITFVDVGAGAAPATPEERDVTWETVAGKGQIRTFVTNLWSSIAGRGSLRQEVVHCQVLHA